MAFDISAVNRGWGRDSDKDRDRERDKTGMGTKTRTVIGVRYHFRGSMELNARNLLLAYMVYL
jgi:hypothetical protein